MTVVPITKTTQQEDLLIQQALAILDSRLRQPSEAINDYVTAKHFCCLKLGNKTVEVFGVLFLDIKHRLIEYREMFTGTLHQASVYPQEVARTALQLNASAVILTHNHPSGETEASEPDIRITERISKALELIDVKVLDHIIVSGSRASSMAHDRLL